MPEEPPIRNPWDSDDVTDPYDDETQSPYGETGVAEDGSDDEEEPTPVKRGPGRPRKAVSEAATARERAVEE
jgi:hypothetical protein